MPSRSLKLTSKTMDRIDAAGSYFLKPASDAKQTGFGDKAKYSWTEVLTVVDTAFAADKTNPDRDVVTIQFKVSADSEKNPGRNYPQWYRFNTSSLEKGEGADDYTMTVISASKLKNLTLAAGFELTEDSDLFEVFKPEGEGERASIVGASVIALIVDKPDKDKDGADIRRQEPTKFYPIS